MICEQALRARQKLVTKKKVTGELLRGSLLERTIHHSKDCPKCARGEGHQVFVLTVTYPGGRTRQFSVRRERVAEARRLAEQLSGTEAGESRAICELNHELLRPERPRIKGAREGCMIEMRRARKLSFGDGLIAEEVSDLRENWMKHADVVLADEAIVATVYEALAKRVPRAVAVAAAGVHRPTWYCDCWCSNTSGTGAMRCWSGRCLRQRFGSIRRIFLLHDRRSDRGRHRQDAAHQQGKEALLPPRSGTEKVHRHPFCERYIPLEGKAFPDTGAAGPIHRDKA